MCWSRQKCQQQQLAEIAQSTDLNVGIFNDAVDFFARSSNSAVRPLAKCFEVPEGEKPTPAKCTYGLLAKLPTSLDQDDDVTEVSEDVPNPIPAMSRKMHETYGEMIKEGQFPPEAVADLDCKLHTALKAVTVVTARRCLAKALGSWPKDQPLTGRSVWQCAELQKAAPFAHCQQGNLLV